MRKLTAVVLALVAVIGLTSSAAFGYYAFTDSSNGYQAQAKAGSLNAPTNLTAAASSSTSATLSWTAPSSPSPTAYTLVQSPGTLTGTCTNLTGTTTSCTATSLVPGTPYNWTLEANDNNWVSSGAAAALTLNKVTPTIAGSGSPATVTVGGSVDDQATVSGGYNPTGTITYSLYSNSGCTGAPLFRTTTGGTVNGDTTYTSASYSPTASGTDTWGISYSGDASNNPVTSCGGSNQTLTVGKATPSVTTAASVSVTVGSSVTDTANLAGGYNPTGTITFTLYGPSPTASCAAQVGQVSSSVSSGNGPYTSPSITPSQAGTYWWITNYGGDSNNLATSNSCGATNESSTVNKAVVGLTTTSTPSSVVVGGSVADQSVLTGGYGPTGTITWTLYSGSGCGGSVVGTTTTGGSVSGDSTYTSTSFTPTVVGTYTWAVAYSGDGNNSSLAAVCGGTGQTLTVTKAAPTVAGSGPTAGTAGTTIAASNVSATLTGGYNHTGTITFTVFGPQTTAPTTCTTGGTTVGSGVTVTTGVNTYNPTTGFTPPSAGNYWWYASYNGDANNTAATSACGSGMSDTVVAYAPPVITTSAAGSVTSSSATMNASVNPEGDTDTVRFCYSTNASQVTTNSCTGTLVSASTSPASGTSSVGETYNLTGLSPGTGYYYDLVVTNSGNAVYYGSPIQSFTTPAATGVTGIEWTNMTKPGGSNISCTGKGTASYACTVSGGGNNSAVSAQIAFVNSSGNPTVYSSTQSETVNVGYDANWKATGVSSLAIAAGASTSTGTGSGTEAGSNHAVMTATFGGFTATLTVTP